MARGFLSGAIWGTVLAVGGLGTVSVLMPLPEGMSQPLPTQEPVAVAQSTASEAELENKQAPESPEPKTEPRGDEPVAPTEIAEPQAEENDAASKAPSTGDSAEPTELQVDVAPEPDMAAQETPDVAQSVDAPEPTTSDTTPETQTVEAPATPARRPADVSLVEPETEAPMLDSPAEPQDTAPTETAAAPIPTPDTGDAIAAFDAPDVGTSPSALSAPGTEAAPGSAAAPTLNAPQSETELSVSTEPAQPPAPPVPSIETPLVPEPETTAPDTTADVGAETPIEVVPSTESEDQPAVAERPQVRRLVPSQPEPAEEDTATAALRPAIGTPAAPLTERSPGNSGRLPSIGGASDAADTPEPVDPAIDKSLPPLQRFAAPADFDPALPKMSILMIDDGTGPLGPDTLDGFPFPVTFVIDPAQPGADERMSAYRALGYEVAALVTLPAAAQPTDVEQSLGGAIAAIPEAVALIEAPGGELQADRSVTEQVTSFVADSGHGLVFLPNGLNTAQAIAQRENVPALSILRDFDGDGQDGRTKRRFLDGAAFRARQDGAVVMLGRLTPDTLSALVLWSLQDRASSVAMVPVSTLLIEQSN
jgi:polysaccharide deacetylase 2 family uncharacterized protein YibQ